MRNIRMIAVDPVMASIGQRIHTLDSSWNEPTKMLADFVAGTNYGAGATEYQVDPDPRSDHGVFYGTSVPYRPITNVFGPYTEDTTVVFIDLSGDQFSNLHGSRGPWPYETPTNNIGGLSRITDPTWIDCDLVADINAGLVDMVVFFAPGAAESEGRYNGLAESYMLAPPDDNGAYGLNGGLYYVPGLTRRCMLVYCNLTRGCDSLDHSYGHATRDNGILLHVWNSWPGYTPLFDHVIENTLTPIDLFLIPDSLANNRGVAGQAQVGTVHYLPNSTSDYDYTDAQTVPCGADAWAQYPNGGPWANGQLNLDDPSRMGTFGPQTDGLDPAIQQFDPSRWPYLWQERHIPRAAGMTDGHYNDWWQYTLDLNNETGMENAVTPPVYHGGVPTPNPIPPSPTPPVPTPPVPTPPTPPVPNPTPEPPMFTIDAIVQKAMNDNGGDTPMSSSSAFLIDPATNQPNDDIHETISVKGRYISVLSKNAVGFIAWTASEIVS